MKRALIILAMAGSALAGYYGREAQDVIDRSAENPIGPYEIKGIEGNIIKVHTRTGRSWFLNGKIGGLVDPWKEIARDPLP
jgi:hypothetical protein